MSPCDMELTPWNSHKQILGGTMIPILLVISPGSESSAARIQRSQGRVVAILRALTRNGPTGSQYINEADVYIHEKGDLDCRDDQTRSDDISFWNRRAEVLKSKYYPLKLAAMGSATHIVIDKEAQAEQDWADQ